MKVDSNSFINILKEIDALSVREVVAIPEGDGLSMYARDPSNTTIVAATIKSAAFPEGCPFKEETGISVPFMLDALVKDKECDMTVENGVITIGYGRSKRARRLIEPESTARPIPQIDLPDQCVVMSDDITNIIKMSCFQEIKSDVGGIRVSLQPDGIMFSANSEVESADMFIEGTSVLSADTQTALFGLKIITPVMKVLPKSTIVTVSLMTKMPMRITIDEDNYSMVIFIAPFIEQE